MFTQCPNCETIFQVTADQLKAASGDVRCGQCLAVFSALDNLSESMESDSKTHEAGSESVSNAQNSTYGDASTSIDKNLEEFFGDLFEDSPDESFNQPITYANSEIPDKNQTRSDGGFFYGANEATIEKILEKEQESDTKIQTEAESETEIETEAKTNSESELLEPPIELSDKLEAAELSSDFDRETEQTDTDISSEADADINPEADTGISSGADADTSPETDADISPEDKDPEGSSPEIKTEKSQIANMPSTILDELEAAKAQHLKPPSTPWVMGSIALMLVFVLQAVYFSRDSLAKNPTYRPILTSACDLLGCEINIEFDTRLIEIIGRDVRSHPTSKKALIAGTTLINNASYAQPYPLLTLTFSDIVGTKLAQRRFTPREYLRSGTDIAAGMPSEIPVQVELHLVDPGKAAVNFEFIAEVDPRS